MNNLFKEYISGMKWIGLLLGLGIVLSVPFAHGQVASETRDRMLQIAKQRGLSAEDILSAASTYTSSKMKDEFVCLNSGGQAGSVIVSAVPSMRIIKYIPTAAPESGSGYNYDMQSKSILKQGNISGQTITWGDTHHPAFSETNGKYDGRYAFINDKANPRIFVIDLRDFETKQIVANPIFNSDHGGAFVTPNSEYIIEGSQYAAPLDRKYHPITQDNFNNHWRGGFTYHKFDNEKGRIIPEQSFTLEAPPYSQDLSDAGKLESEGFSFTNSFCSERYVGGIEKGRPPFEAGCSARDTDFLHIINWKKAEQVFKEGKKLKRINGHAVIPLEVSISEGIMFLAPEPKSPHGADVTPDGRFIVVAGKLDTHATVFDIRKIKEAIEKKEFAGKDPYGLPILDLQKTIHGQVEIGLGPLHTQFDSADTGVAYTSVYIDSVVVKWNYRDLKVLDKVPVQYNIGHLVAMQGDSVDPKGKYVIALNKLAIDRFAPVGPLHPQNHQLIDTSGEKMRVLYDMPLPMGEPHYTVCIASDGFNALDKYPEGTDPTTMKPSGYATKRGGEKSSRQGGKVVVKATASVDGFYPRNIDVQQGDQVELHVTNVESTPDRIFKVSVGGYGVMGIFAPGKTATLAFTATSAGQFTIRADQIDAPFPNRKYALMKVGSVSTAESRRKVRAKQLAAQLERPLPAFLANAKSENLKEGEAEFLSYGCGGCHQPGREMGGPDLNDVTVRRDAKWLKDWIMHPEKYYDDPSITAMIQRFGVRMPNQNVKEEDALKLVKFLTTWTSAPTATARASSDSPGEATYNKICFACHASGVAGAPKIGDKALWEARIAQGNNVLYSNAIKGFTGKTGMMPAKGGCGECSDADVKAAVDFMIGKSK